MTATNVYSVTGPIEVWLSQENLKIHCTVVKEDEQTYTIEVGSLSMRGAQREITGHLIREGYKPVGRWDTETSDPAGSAIETHRKFAVRNEPVGDVSDKFAQLVKDFQEH